MMFSCEKEDKYLYYENPTPQPVSNRDYPIVTLAKDKKIDVLWVVDNSGSMSDIQRNIERNAGRGYGRLLSVITWIEDVILTKQRGEYKQRLEKDPFDYDGWFELAKLEEEHGDVNSVRETYERAVANVPPSEEKDHCCAK